MSEQYSFELRWPRGRRADGSWLHGASLIQVRDGMEEPITPSPAYIYDEDSNLFLPVSKNNPLPTQLTGHIQEFAVSSWEEIAPNEVPKGSLAILIGTDDIRQTDGEEWLPL